MLWSTQLLLLSNVAFGLQIPLQLTAPSNAAKLSTSLISFSIEQDRWTDWAGSTSRNDFFYNTLNNLGQLTGTPPQIRIGANSEDHTNYDPSLQFSQATFPAPSANVPYPEATKIAVGDGYYQSAKFLPPNTHVIWGVNFGSNNLSSAYLEAKSILKAFSSPEILDAGIKLDALEFGNEADLYKNNGLRASTYNISQYATEWLTFATNVSTSLKLSPMSIPKLWAASFAGSSHSTSGFSPQAIFNQGVLSSPVAPLISTISQHRYSGSFCSGSSGLLQDLMTKSTIRGNLTDLQPDIAAVHAKGLDYVLGETNSYSCHGAPGVSNTAGAAIWTLDYLLFASQIGISKVFFHEGIGFKYNLVQPSPLPRSTLDGTALPAPLAPHIQPQYYAAIIAAEAIGRPSGGTVAIELKIDNIRLAGYAFYDGATGKVSKVLLINSQAYFSGSTASRGSIDVSFSFDASGNAPKRMSIKRLSIPHADDIVDLKWGGQTYETADGKVVGELQVEVMDVTKVVSIHDTEVVLLSFS
ncbi:hypothetical protein CPB83DRAFT_911422 [Crepidotus variabilis]|uniref:Beta-glucuronidase C-terminal domain-containing protein n=1 Tax=Crepidotus variabilis TaxID=179855 RepID=A0A9P6E4B3_9AGAR|nr:hypothetical protein CPB83DRAFT_911422 [Crepidotus variabilis]